MLDLKRVLAAKPRDHERGEAARLTTPWGEALDDAAVLWEHPRPQFARQSVRMLNGYWEYAFVACENAGEAWKTAQEPAAFDGQILVPFSPEAPASGVERQLQPDQLLWYRQQVPAPELSPGYRCLLHFDAVDYACACYCNGVQVGAHVGGYLPFAFDITDALALNDQVIELALCVYDPSDTGTQPRGKQKLHPGDIWYTAQSGIWQSVWLETVPGRSIESVEIQPDPAGQMLGVKLHLSGGGGVASAIVRDFGRQVAQGEIAVPSDGQDAVLQLPVPHPHLWSPDDPFLYQLELCYGDDAVQSYCAFRTVEVKPDAAGTPRFFLNGRQLQVRGVLDQGYWPDGLLTAPDDAALVHDIRSMKALGFNMLRKHLKVESDRWYYHCDRLGMLVWQDMVSGGDAYDKWHTSYKPTLFKASWTHYADDTPSHRQNLAAGDEGFRREWEETCLGAVRHLENHPCVVTWVLFNEGWGQFDAARMTELVREADPTRPIDSTSGWYDQRCGDYFSVHNYFRPLDVFRDPRKKAPRAFVVSEFGGLTLPVEGHSMLPLAYGYEGFADAGEWRDAVIGQLARLQALEPEGVAGYVYTQLSDVEEETNGLLTYDRRVNKMLL